MKLFQVRKGQFVFYENELHKVYSVKPMFKKSVHMYRLKDMKQVLTTAKILIFTVLNIMIHLFFMVKDIRLINMQNQKLVIIF